MGFSFFETMEGHLVDPRGRRHPVSFEIKAESTHFGGWLRLDGAARVTGVVHAEPWAEAAAIEGTLRASLLGERRIEYDLRFRGDDATYRLCGTKHLSWRRPLHSASNMVTELHCDGELVASGEMRFDLRDLPGFLGSWAPGTSVRRVDLAGPSARAADAAVAVLEPDHIETLRALGEAIIAPGERVPAFDDRSLALVLGILPHLPPHLLTAYRAGLSLLDVMARTRHRARFAELDRLTRERMVRGLDDSGAGRALLLGLGMPLKSGHFSRRDYLDAIGLPSYANPVAEKPPRYLQVVHVPDDLEAETELPADVVVIGTGAGGGPVAALLAEAGLAVALVEEGRYERRPEFVGGPEARMLRFWRDGGMNLSLGNVPVAVPLGRMVGGSTAINSGTCFRTPDPVLLEWRCQLGLPADFEPERFSTWLDAAETELQVEEADARYLGRIAEIVGRGADAMGVPHGPLRRNAPGCDGQGLCVVGCPTGAKRSTNVSYVPRALQAGAHLFTGMPVTRLLRTGRQVIGVEARGADRHGRRRVLRIRARAVVVACGAIHSPMLLQDNGFSHRWLGRNLSVHPALGMFALCDRDMEGWRAIPQSYQVHGLVDERVRFEGFYAPPQLAAPAMPFHGAELTRWMDAQRRVGQFGFMVRDRGAGSVRRGLHGRPMLRYDVTTDVLDLLQRGAATLAELLVRGGAVEVAAGVGRIDTVRTVDEARRIARAKLRPADFKIMAFHPLGTCRMAATEREGVVDFDHRVFGTDNLYVIDGASVPTSLGVNPQITIMAMATRAAERLAVRLG